jgi:tRNA-specific 2-thiouridylase
LFPIGGYKKSEIRKLAKKFRLPNFAKKDSQGICFIGKINVTNFLKRHIKAPKGQIVDTQGEILGEHDGLPFYTIGQRSGMKLGGHGPYYVVDKNKRKNQLIVTNNPKDKMLWKKVFTLKKITWVNEQPKLPLRAGVVIRYHHPAFQALIKKQKNGKLLVSFLKPQRAITSGQSAVIYKDQEVLGGGVIESVR